MRQLAQGAIRQAFYDQLVKFSGVRVDAGRIRRFEEEDFVDPRQPHQRIARVVINTLRADSVEGGNFIASGCCAWATVASVDVVIVMLIDYASEDELEAVEVELWPLIAAVQIPNECRYVFKSRVVQPGSVTDSVQVVTATLNFEVEFNFRSAEPDRFEHI